jgi:pimeloyl-ACP methyl ester carboxylesterase
MMRRRFSRDGLSLCLHDAGGPGLPIVFQHGLGGDAAQTAEALPDASLYRRITLECRGHGGSEAGDPQQFSITTFAEDVAAMIAAEIGGPVVVGGISMGAAIALRLAVRRPDLVRALVLVRPAWGTEPAPANMAPNAEVGRLLKAMDPASARTAFAASDTARRLRAESPDNMKSLMGFFDRAPQAVTAELLTRISADGPGVFVAEVSRLAVPTLVMGCAEDAIHPLALARDLAALIPGARFVDLPPKGSDKAGFLAGLQDQVAAFLGALPSA